MQEERCNKRAIECQFVVSALSMKAGLSTDFNSCPYKTLDELQLAKHELLAQAGAATEAEGEQLLTVVCGGPIRNMAS